MNSLIEVGLKTRKVLNQGFLVVKLKLSCLKCYSPHHDFVNRYGISVSQMITDNMSNTISISDDVFSGVRVARSLVFCVMFFLDRCLSFRHFSFGHCVVCSSLIGSFWLPLWYLVVIVLSVLLWLAASDYPFGILWSLCCLFFFDWQLLITPLVSFGLCVVCSSLIGSFWLPLWYLLAFVLSVLLWLAASDYLPLVCSNFSSICRIHKQFLSSFMTYHRGLARVTRKVPLVKHMNCLLFRGIWVQSNWIIRNVFVRADLSVCLNL